VWRHVFADTNCHPRSPVSDVLTDSGWLLSWFPPLGTPLARPLVLT
jgi:hypothetical protein